MKISDDIEGHEEAIIDLFTTTFTASEGAQEGKLVGTLARNLLADTAPDDIQVFTAWRGERLIGAALFSRLTYPRDARTVFLLSPMAVATDSQGTGVGQALLHHALAVLRDQGVDIAVTYGDPAFYGKLGFRPMSEATARAPLPMSQPEGWIGQALTGGKGGDVSPPLQGPCRCVAALDDPALW